jgi:hypothetical protein
MMRSYFFEGLDYAALAERMGVPVGTVKSRLFRCLQGISEAMERFQSLEVDARPLSPPRVSRSVALAPRPGESDS